MNFKQVMTVLDTLMPNTKPGFSPLDLPPVVLSELESDPQWVNMLGWFTENGLDNPLSVIKSESGGVSVSNPGIWSLGGQPVILFGFDKKGPIVIPFSTINGVVVAGSKQGLYTVTHNGEEFPIQFRLHMDGEDEFPTVLSQPKAANAKVLNTGGGGGDWTKLRDVIEWGESGIFEVLGMEVKSLTKNGKKFNVYLIKTDSHTLSVNAKQYSTVESLRALWELRGNDGELVVEFTQDGEYEGHKMFRVSQATVATPLATTEDDDTEDDDIPF